MIPFPFNASWMPNRVQSEVDQGGRPIRRHQGAGRRALPAGGQRSAAARRRQGVRLRQGRLRGARLAVRGWHRNGGGGSALSLRLPLPLGCKRRSRRRRARAASGGACWPSLQERLVGLKHVRTDKTTHAIAEGLSLDVQDAGAGGLSQGRAGRRAAGGGIGSALEHGALASAGADGGGGDAGDMPPSRRRRPRGDGCPGSTSSATPRSRAKLRDLIATFERESYRPEPLKDLVTADEAQARWRALRAFAEKNGHLLVTNGPYRLKQWTAAVGRAGGRPRDHLSAGLRHLRPLRQSAASGDRRR